MKKTQIFIFLILISGLGKIVNGQEKPIEISTELQDSESLNRKQQEKDSIKAMEIEKKDHTLQNKFASRTFILPTSFGLKKGIVQYKNVLLTRQQFDFGITNYFSVGVGTELFSYFTKNGDYNLILTPKFSHKLTNNIFISAGTYSLLAFKKKNREEEVSKSYPLFRNFIYTNITLGNEVDHLTAGVAYYRTAIGDLFSGFVLNGRKKLGRYFALMSENILTRGYPIYFGNHGIQLTGKEVAFDVGIMLVRTPFLNLNYVVPIPFVGFSYQFKTKKL